jgi:hypothetical protein
VRSGENEAPQKLLKLGGEATGDIDPAAVLPKPPRHPFGDLLSSAVS